MTGTKALSGVSGDALTFDQHDSSAQSVAFDGTLIRAVGPAGSVGELGPDRPWLDFGSRTVLPGFVDPHVHFEAISVANATMVDCRAPRCSSVADVLQALSDDLWRADDTGWLVGQGNLFFDQKLLERRMPTRAELDSISTDVAIVIRAGGHRSVLNSRAFERSDVTRYIGRAGTSGDAVVEFDEHGEPTGVIAELDHTLPFPKLSAAELRAALVQGGQDLLLSYGVTSIGEISDTVDGVRTIAALVRDGALPTRQTLYLWAPGTMSVEAVCDWERELGVAAIPGRFDVRGLKVFADGGYSARNAATLCPYEPAFALTPGSRGKLSLNPSQIAERLAEARSAGLQLAVHANGERAQAAVCEAVIAAGSPAGALPVRIEHAGNLVTTPKTTDAWRRAGVVPVPQPSFINNFAAFLPTYLGEHGAHGRFPFRSLLDDGWRIPASSDAWFGAEQGQTNPFYGIWCAVARRGFFGEALEPEQAITVTEALRMYTQHSAEAIGCGHERGSLQPGKVADLVVLDRDPRAVGPDELLDVRVDYVIVGGELVHSRDGAEPYSVVDA